MSTLLDSYDPERREAVRQTAALASSIYQDWVRTRQEHAGYWADMAAGGDLAERARRQLGESLVRTFRREFNNIPASLGYRYEGSPICIPDGTADPTPPALEEYVPTARPGHRAPHVWLGPGQSTLDRYGPGFTLVLIDRDATEAAPMTEAATELGMPLSVCTIDDPVVASTARELYQGAFTLVRPDGYVAWRSDDLPPAPRKVLDVVRGATHVSAARASPVDLSSEPPREPAPRELAGSG